MGTMDKLDDKKVGTDGIIAVYQNYFTKFVDKEPELLDEAIKFIDKFLLKPTPKYVEGREPKLDTQNHIIFSGEEEKYLYQFWYENIGEFTEKTRVIDNAMKVIPSVVMEIRRQLKESQQTGMTPNLPLISPVQSPPVMDQKPSFSEKYLGMKKEPIPISTADLSVENMMKFVLKVGEKWGNWKEWYVGSIKYENDTGSWSDINDRSGMEYMLARMREFFNYWIITEFMPIYQYAMDNNLMGLMKYTGHFVDALARTQHESEQLNQNKPNI